MPMPLNHALPLCQVLQGLLFPRPLPLLSGRAAITDDFEEGIRHCFVADWANEACPQGFALWILGGREVTGYGVLRYTCRKVRRYLTHLPLHLWTELEALPPINRLGFNLLSLMNLIMLFIMRVLTVVKSTIMYRASFTNATRTRGDRFYYQNTRPPVWTASRIRTQTDTL